MTSELLDKYREKFTELRVSFMSVLELHIRKGDLKLLDAVSQFEKATLMPPSAAARYLELMSEEGSPFKNVATLQKAAQKKGAQK